MKKNGFTLLEIMFAAAILSGLLVSVIGVFVYCMEVQENSGNTMYALNQMRAKIEELKAENFSDLPTLGGNFSLTGLTGKMRVEGLADHPVSQCVYPPGAIAANCSLWDVRIVAGWAQKGGRIVGEGILGSLSGFDFSDLNGNGRIDSPIEIETAIARRQ